MGKKLWWLPALLILGFLQAQEPPRETLQPPRVSTPKPTEELWEAAFLEQGRAGYFHTAFYNVEVAGEKLIRARQALMLTVKRFGETIQLRMQTGTDETEDGKVLGVFMQMEQQGGPLVLEGRVKDNVLKVSIPKAGITREIPWNDRVIGMRAQERLFQAKPFKAGDRLEYQAFEPSLNTVLNVKASVYPEEEIELLNREKKKLFRAVLASDRIEVPGNSVQLPPITVWMDRDGKVLRRLVEIPGLGKVTLVRTTREVANAPGSGVELIDIGRKSMIPVNRRIARPNDTESVVYRITIEDEKPETALVEDARQKIKGIKDRTLELHIQAVRSAPEDGKGEAGKEFLEDCHFINRDDPQVQKLTKLAVGNETDPWFKARRIEGWVNRSMRGDATIPLGPAAQVAKQLRGDCRQYALLTAAMCRAADIPARTAIGLIYAEDRQGRAMFGFHMWVEVFVRGQWLGLDATLGEGTVGASHIKVTDHSWAGVQSLTPLLPLQRVLGKMKIEVVQVAY